jgi:serine O-acetyltransferase
MFDELREDFVTYEGRLDQPGLWVMVVYRFGRWRYGIKTRAVRKPFSLAYKVLKLGTQMTTGIELPCETKVGRRLRIDHFSDIIISGDAVIGDDVIIRNGVTIGLRKADDRGSPVIGNRVDIGAGAKLLGKIRIGDDVIIGANAVVIEDVPSGCLAVGVPARIIPRKDLNRPEAPKALHLVDSV